MDQGIKGVSPFNVAADLHTAGSDTIFVQIYMDPPPGVPGHIAFFTSARVAKIQV